MNKNVTSHDVAKHAQVSQATVSRILAGKNNFSQDTIDRVKSSAEELGYKRNILASSLVSNCTNLIAVISAKTNNPFIHESLSAISQMLQKNNKKILYLEVEEEHTRQINEILDEVIGYQVDGIIILFSVISKVSQEFVRTVKVPVVIFNRPMVNENTFVVASDNSEAGRRAAGYFVEKGYFSFGVIAGNGVVMSEGSVIESYRSKNFIDRLKELGYDDISVVYCDDYSFEDGAAAAREIFGAEKHPHALFCDSDRLAFGAVHVLRNELGLRIPEDVAVMGFDNTAISAWNIFNLTTFRHDNEGMAEAALKYIEDCNNGIERRDRIRLFSCELVTRGSA